MPVKTPTHPGRFLRRDCIEKHNLSMAEAATLLQVEEVELFNVCFRWDPITADLAVRIEMAFGASAEKLLRLQADYDLDRARLEAQDIDRVRPRSVQTVLFDLLTRLTSSPATWLGRIRLTKREWGYKHGEIGDPASDSGNQSGNVSWIKRAFWFDKYVYFVRIHTWPKDGKPTYYIGRAPKAVEFLTHEESITLPDGTSGLIEESDEYRHQEQQSEEALTKFGYWLSTPWTDMRYTWSHPEDRRMPLPNEILTFGSESAAYEYMNRVSGREIPSQVKHLAWLTIGLSTFLWQVISWGPAIYKFFAKLI